MENQVTEVAPDCDETSALAANHVVELMSLRVLKTPARTPQVARNEPRRAAD
jgi:hypothetical protein